MFAFHSSDPDDRLTQAVQALREAPLQAEPTSESLERTIAALAVTETRTAALKQPAWRRRGMVVTGSLAAALLVAAFWFDQGGSKLAFGDVLDRLREAKQFSFQAETLRESQPQSGLKSIIRVSEPDKSRTDWITPQEKIVSVHNGTRTIMIYQRSRTVIEHKIPPGAFRSTTQLLDELQEAVEKNARPLGKREIDGVMAQGFEAVINDRKFVVWANAKTGNPVRIECTPLGELAKWMPVQVLSHFKFDQHFPDELFSLKAPEGYDVVQNEGWQPIEELKRVLEVYAQRHDGQFPAELSSDDAKLLAELGIPESRDARSAEQRKLARSLDNVRMILKNYRKNTDFRYLPGGKLGDAERPILWLAEPFVTGAAVPLVPSTQKVQKPELPKVDDADRKFKVLYADLHVEQRMKRELPPIPTE